jgi:hypothetical protein
MNIRPANVPSRAAEKQKAKTVEVELENGPVGALFWPQTEGLAHTSPGQRPGFIGSERHPSAESAHHTARIHDAVTKDRRTVLETDQIDASPHAGTQ